MVRGRAFWASVVALVVVSWLSRAATSLSHPVGVHQNLHFTRLVYLLGVLFVHTNNAVDGLYKKLLPLVAAELHSRLAHELVQSGFVRRTGAVPGVTLMKKSKEYVESLRTEVVVEDPFRLMDPDDAPKTDEESRLVSATLRAHRLINADRVNQSRARTTAAAAAAAAAAAVP